MIPFESRNGALVAIADDKSLALLPSVNKRKLKKEEMEYNEQNQEKRARFPTFVAVSPDSTTHSSGDDETKFKVPRASFALNNIQVAVNNIMLGKLDF